MDMFSNKNSEGASGTSGQQTQASGQQTQASGQQKQDYGDKGFDFVSKKAGHDFDPKTDEKITDGVRGLYEKATGSKISDKVSN